MSKNTQLGNLVNGIYVDSTGKVGVGTQSPSAPLHVFTTGAVTAQFTRDLATDSTLRILSDNDGAIIDTQGIHTMRFFTSDTERMRISSAGATTFTGTVTSQTGFKLPANGNGTSPTLAYNNSLGFGVSGTGIFFGNLYNSDLSTAMQLRVTNSGGTDITAMTITPLGKVGINNNSPTAKFEVLSGYDPAGFFKCTNNEVPLSVINTENSVATVGYRGSTTANEYNVRCGANGEHFVAYTGNTERMRILSNGNVLIGNTTDSGDRLRVTGSIASNGTSAGMFFQNRAAGNFLGFYADNTSTFLIYNTNVGNIATINQSNGNYTALSDVNKKKDFEQSNIGLNEVLQLKPTLYRMKTDDESSAKELGFIAQEVKEFIPQAYSESGEGEDKFIGLNQMPIIAALTKAIQELKAEIDILKNK